MFLNNNDQQRTKYSCLKCSAEFKQILEKYFFKFNLKLINKFDFYAIAIKKKIVKKFIVNFFSFFLLLSDQVSYLLFYFFFILFCFIYFFFFLLSYQPMLFEDELKLISLVVIPIHWLLVRRLSELNMRNESVTYTQRQTYFL